MKNAAKMFLLIFGGGTIFMLWLSFWADQGSALLATVIGYILPVAIMISVITYFKYEEDE